MRNQMPDASGTVTTSKRAPDGALFAIRAVQFWRRCYRAQQHS
jgi:hypothetical protein